MSWQSTFWQRQSTGWFRLVVRLSWALKQKIQKWWSFVEWECPVRSANTGSVAASRFLLFGGGLKIYFFNLQEIGGDWQYVNCTSQMYFKANWVGSPNLEKKFEKIRPNLNFLNQRKNCDGTPCLTWIANTLKAYSHETLSCERSDWRASSF